MLIKRKRITGKKTASRISALALGSGNKKGSLKTRRPPISTFPESELGHWLVSTAAE
jgi:hypothetical protein